MVGLAQPERRRGDGLLLERNKCAPPRLLESQVYLLLGCCLAAFERLGVAWKARHTGWQMLRLIFHCLREHAWHARRPVCGIGV